MAEPETMIAPPEAKRLVVCKIIEEQLKDENKADGDYEHLQNALVAAGINDNALDDINEIREDEASHAQTLLRIHGRYCR